MISSGGVVEIKIGPQDCAGSSLGIPFPFAFPNQNSVGSPMSNSVRNLAILGATGSIGKSTAEVVETSGGRLKIVGLTANTSLGELCEMARRFRPRWVAAADRGAASLFDWSGLPAGTELLVGQDGIERLAASDEVDVVVAAIVGSAGLRGTWAALEAGKTVALANKETLVMAGPLVMRLARERGAALLPVDSEHSAVFQALQAGRRNQLRRIILTASGGPFLRHAAQQLSQVTVRDALAHPTWEMGQKITIDSATMMNKALEVIEARWLFDVRPDQIEVVVHPQSIVHSLVEFVDGSVLAHCPSSMLYHIRTVGSVRRRSWIFRRHWR
jgi:1-deoxy-D-xylulose-5-phosphate reductoisomerase